MSNLFRPREYVAHYNVQTQNYLGLRRGLPVYAPIPGNHVVGEVGYLLQGGICVIPRQLAPHAEDKLSSSNPSPDVEDAKNNSTSCSEVQAAQDKNAEQRATCGGAECGEEVLGEDDTYVHLSRSIYLADLACSLTVYDSEFCPDADSSLATSLRRDADVVQLQSEDGSVLDAFVIFPYDPSKEIAGEDAEPSKKVPDKDCLDDCGNESDDT